MIDSNEGLLRADIIAFKDRTTIDHLPQLKMLAACNGGSVPFSWSNKHGKRVNLQMISIAYKGNTGLQGGDRLAVLVMKQDDSREPVAIVDCELSPSQKIAVISLPEDLLSHHDLLQQHGISQSKKITTPFEVVEEFKKTDLSQTTLAATQAILEIRGIGEIYVWEDRTLEAIREYPYARSAYFKYSAPITKFKPPGEMMSVGWQEEGSAHVYSIPTIPTVRQVALLRKAFSSTQYMEKRSINQVQMNRDAFKKLKKRISALERQGTLVDEVTKLKLRGLDTWLCEHDRTWHTSFPAKPTNPTVPISTTAK